MSNRFRTLAVVLSVSLRSSFFAAFGVSFGASLVGITLVVVAAAGSLAAAEPPRVVEFNRDIRPILSDACWRCHGPDGANRKGDLRLDTEAGAIGAGAIGPRSDSPIVRGAPDKSELFRRLTSTDPDQRMPPADSGRSLEPRQIELVRRWIEQGAKWESHWSFLPPRPVSPPDLHAGDSPVDLPAGWPRTAIDSWVAARLAPLGVGPSVEAERTTLLRRATLDLTGLPPTLDELDAFLSDARPDAWERRIDRLLASPRYGERMAIRWLEAARYADTSGYQSDGPRAMWRWRDWVIDAFNRNLPFDQFTVEQLAGDLLPGATLDQRIATGFHRNHRGNSEGGIIPEEYAVEYVVDRVDTTGTVWLGLTLGCVRCHDHKFDPLTQRDYYQLFAYFNNIPEHGRAIKEGNSPPYIPAPTSDDQRRLDELRTSLDEAELETQRLEPKLAAAQKAWEKNWRRQAPDKLAETDRWTLADGLVARMSMDAGQRTKDAADVGEFGYFDKFSIACRFRPDGAKGGTIVARMTDSPRGDGYAVRLVDGRIHVDLVKRWLDDAIRVETAEPIAASADAASWRHLTVVYDGSRTAAGVAVYLDGRSQKMVVRLDALNQSFVTKQPLRIGYGGGPDSAFHGEIDDVRVYDRRLDPEEAAATASGATIAQIVGRADAERSPAERAKLRACFLATGAPDAMRQAHQRLVERRRALSRFEESLPTVMVMHELPTPRPTHLLLRGEYDKPGPRVERDVPTVFHRLPAGAPNDRLGLARWMVDRQNPLTARVAVNRLWQSFFGVGLVKTTEDFGSQGEMPPNQPLLDWLAIELPERGWDLKSLQRTIVTSSTYRQRSGAGPLRGAGGATIEDPENRLLARGPRFRLPAEAIRDQALAAAGLLVERLGGPSVKPYQPADFWKDLATDSQYDQSRGADLYRRGIYTFWKRTVSPPLLTTFDAATRDTCAVKPNRTNTPLQALTLLNETTFVEAARALAERMLRDGGDSAGRRIEFAFRRLTGRTPSAAERAILEQSLTEHRAWYAARHDAAERLLATGDSPRDPRLDVVELAAHTALAATLLNLDEVVTKE